MQRNRHARSLTREGSSSQADRSKTLGGLDRSATLRSFQQGPGANSGIYHARYRVTDSRQRDLTVTSLVISVQHHKLCTSCISAVDFFTHDMISHLMKRKKSLLTCWFLLPSERSLATARGLTPSGA